MLYFTTSNSLKRAKTCKSRRVLLSRKTVYLGISKLILLFPYTFHIIFLDGTKLKIVCKKITTFFKRSVSITLWSVSSMTETSRLKNVVIFFQTFHILCTILSIVNFHTVLSIFLFLFYWSHLNAGAIHSSSNSSLCRKRSIMVQLNVQAAAAENEKRYTLSNIIYIEFQIHTLFFEVFLDKQLFLRGK